MSGLGGEPQEAEAVQDLLKADMHEAKVRSGLARSKVFVVQGSDAAHPSPRDARQINRNTGCSGLRVEPGMNAWWDMVDAFCRSQ